VDEAHATNVGRQPVQFVKEPSVAKIEQLSAFVRLTHF